MKDNRIRIGDRVRIVDPRLFVRCGYSLHLPHVVENLRADTDLMRDVAALVARVSGSPRVDLFEGRPGENHAANRILHALAYLEAQRANWGGRERRIYLSDPVPGLQDVVVQLYARRVVKTGTYCAGGGGYSYDGEYDYDPPGLGKEKTHVLFEFCRPASSYGLDDLRHDEMFRSAFGDKAWIPASHLVKVGADDV